MTPPPPPSSSPLRITMVSGPYFPTPPAPTGAAQRLWYDLCLRFARRGHHVTILAQRAAGQPAEETVEGMRILRRTSMRQTPNIKWDIVRDLYYSIRMAMLAPAADIMVTNSFWMPVVGNLMGRKYGRTFVSIGRFPKGQMRFYTRCARLHAVSSAIREAVLAEVPQCDAKIKVIPNPIESGVFVPPATPRDYSGTRTILYTGRVHPEKGLHVLIEAFARLHERFPFLRLKIVGATEIVDGGGGEPYMAKLRPLIGSHPVEFVPPIYGRPQLAACLQAAHYYCYPSLAEKGESFGIAPLEAMGTACPTVVSALQCFRDFVDDGVNGMIFNHRDADPVSRLVEAFERLIGDDALAGRLGAAAAATAPRFGYDAVADLYLADFRSLVDQDAAAAR